MSEKEDVAEWVVKLKNLLVEKAYRHFETRPISLEDFTKFLMESAFVPRWDDLFIPETYELYLRKVSDAASSLEDKMSD